MNIKRIGVLTSGGDAPGMNPAIRAVVRACDYYGIECYGIKKGYQGLLSGEIFELTLHDVSKIMCEGGTILKTARCLDFQTEEGMAKGRKMADVYHLDALVIIGGDGSFRGALGLSKLGLPVIGIPATIDNDIGCSEYTIGYDTAMNTVIECIDKLKETSCSHERCSLVEVMGRNAGHIALNCAIATGAEVVLMPEKQYDLDRDIIHPIIECRNRGKTNYLVIIAEGIGGTLKLADDISAITGIRTTATILGHVQRGGSPTVRDRVTAALMGVKAVQCLKNGEINKIIAAKGDNCIAVDIEEALEMSKTVDPERLEADEILRLYYKK